MWPEITTIFSIFQGFYFGDADYQQCLDRQVPSQVDFPTLQAYVADPTPYLTPGAAEPGAGGGESQPPPPLTKPPPLGDSQTPEFATLDCVCIIRRWCASRSPRMSRWAYS